MWSPWFSCKSGQINQHFLLFISASCQNKMIKSYLVNSTSGSYDEVKSHITFCKLTDVGCRSKAAQMQRVKSDRLGVSAAAICWGGQAVAVCSNTNRNCCPVEAGHFWEEPAWCLCADVGFPFNHNPEACILAGVSAVLSCRREWMWGWGGLASTWIGPGLSRPPHP